MTPFRADLHTHTTCSDGTYSPIELVELAVASGLSGLSITDHDTIAAYAEAVPAALKNNILLLPGVEFSAAHQNETVHILGYGFNLNSPDIQSLCNKHQERRTKRLQAILELLHKKRMPLDPSDLASVTSGHPASIGRPHIALAMVAKGYVSSFQQAFDLYIGEGACCYIRDPLFSVEETIATLHQGGGVAVIAHPHLIKNPRLLEQLLLFNFDGIEGYYGNFSLLDNQRWLKIAHQKKWLLTGGSDFHGKIKPTLPLGRSWVNRERFDLLSGYHAHLH